MIRRLRLLLALVLVASAIGLTTHFVRIGTQNPWTDGATIYIFNKPITEGHIEPAFGIIAARDSSRRNAAIGGIAIPILLLAGASVLVFGFKD
jgi:hypothetical protein